MNLGRGELLTVVLFALSAIGLAWFLRTSAWKRWRLAFVAVGLLAVFLVVTRRLGVGELLVVVALVLVPVALAGMLRRSS
jgi:hypothetical protein